MGVLKSVGPGGWMVNDSVPQVDSDWTDATSGEYRCLAWRITRRQ